MGKRSRLEFFNSAAHDRQTGGGWGNFYSTSLGRVFLQICKFVKANNQ